MASFQFHRGFDIAGHPENRRIPRHHLLKCPVSLTLQCSCFGFDAAYIADAFIK
jgi:hypothetical protein